MLCVLGKVTQSLSASVSSSIRYLLNTDVLELSKTHVKFFQDSAQHSITNVSITFPSFLSVPLAQTFLAVSSHSQPAEAGMAHAPCANLETWLILTRA